MIFKTEENFLVSHGDTVVHSDRQALPPQPLKR